ncbi:MAG: hypothetical protein H0T46_26400 [Deltaproteobacteria bacterium]|nr:hypothetical protein [Deltaproteobacteria bacterium]
MNRSLSLYLYLLGALLAATAGCSGCSGDTGNVSDAGPDGPHDNTFDQCGGDPQSFARQSMLSLLGRRPKGQAEVNVYADLYKAADGLGDDPKDVVARAIMTRPEFVERWTNEIMDALHVQRLDVQSEADCWDTPLRTSVTPALAMAIRDKTAAQGGDGQSFTMLDLARSSLALDDLTPIYRAQLFSMVSHPIPAANVGAVQAELARRADFGSTFDASYLHRDVVCLGCHNSETAVTDSDDPITDRHWPVPGLAERALFGDSKGVSPERAHAAFRVDNFVDNGQGRPWGWSTRCGTFASPSLIGDDIADVDGKLASVTGKRATVYDLEAALARGFAALRGTALPNDAAITDPDTALAWLVTLKITEDVWRHTTGTSLTISNYFPRNEAAGKELYRLATTFARSGYSLKALLSAIVGGDYFNRQAPDAGCGPSPYTYPNVFDPWVTSEADEARRHNGPGDAVTAVDARTLVTAISGALDWPAPPLASRFPDHGENCVNTTSCSRLMQLCGSGQCCDSAMACQMGGYIPYDEIGFQRGVGTFLRNSERGFRGLDFQARLSWEDRYGGCAKPGWVQSDFVDKLAAAGAQDATATARDVVMALKDRLIGEPAIVGGDEEDAIAAIVGPLDAPGGNANAGALRRVCAALLGSPQFLLQGIAGRGGEVPKLTPTDSSYDATCAALAATGIGVAGRVLTCEPGAVTLAAARTQATPVERVMAVTPEPRPRVKLPADPRRVPAPTRSPRM